MKGSNNSNSILFKKWNEVENEYMSKRLFNIKSEINTKCPHSFINANIKNANKKSSLYSKYRYALN